MERPTTTLHLPVSGFDVQIVTYYTKGEDDAINRFGLDKAEAVLEQDDATKQDRVRLINYPPDRFRREVAKLLEMGIVSAIQSGTALTVGPDFVANLPTKDADLLTESLIKVRSGTDSDPKADAGPNLPSATSSLATEPTPPQATPTGS